MVCDSANAQENNVYAKNRSVIKKVFRISYFIARKYWAQASFKNSVEFITTLDVSDLQDHVRNTPEDATYVSDASSSEFITITGEHIERKLLESLRSAKYFPLLVDESANDQNREQDSVFIKWTAKSLFPEDHFIGNNYDDKRFLLINNDKNISYCLMKFKNI